MEGGDERGGMAKDAGVVPGFGGIPSGEQIIPTLVPSATSSFLV